MTAYRGLTWDHPRGRHALERAASAGLADGTTLNWDVHPLEGFESSPIAELAERYDLIVLDHPHLGDALAADCLTPIDEVFDADRIAAWRRGAIGPSIASYEHGGRLWALPLDAATQVSARLLAAVPEAPADWSEVRELAASGAVAPNLAGPHAFLSLCSIAVSFGDDPGAGDVLFDADAFGHAVDLLAALARTAPEDSLELNPIGLLDRMRDAGDIHYVPLVYGYVTHSSPQLAFGAPPAGPAGLGSTIGGTGIALTRRTPVDAALRAHLEWLLSDETQRGFIPANDGQPSALGAWTDAAVDRAAHGFYSATIDTIEGAWVRPRHLGYIPFQSEASALVRDAVLGRSDAEKVRQELERRFAAVRTASDIALAQRSPA